MLSASWQYDPTNETASSLKQVGYSAYAGSTVDICLLPLPASTSLPTYECVRLFMYGYFSCSRLYLSHCFSRNLRHSNTLRIERGVPRRLIGLTFSSSSLVFSGPLFSWMPARSESWQSEAFVPCGRPRGEGSWGGRTRRGKGRLSRLPWNVFSILRVNVVSQSSRVILDAVPKFCFFVKPSRFDLCSSVHAICTKIPTPEDRTTFVNQSLSKLSVLVDSSFPVEQRNFRRVSALKRELSSNSLTLLQTDKSGLFAVLPVGTFSEKALVAISEVFVKCKDNVAVKKQEVCRILAQEEITATLNRISGVSQSSFGLKFLVKDYKVGFPFRVVINENGSWQK